MSNAFAIAAVTAVMKSILENGFTAFKLSDILTGLKVSALPPDRVISAGGAEPNQLNLFFYQATMNQGWRNVALPSRNAGGDRLSNPPLPLNLHYLLTAYGEKDFYAEILLGHAMHILHETSVLTREAIRRALSPAVPDPNLPVQLATSHLADQVEQIKITPEILNTEEVSKLWSAVQAHYRPTAAYQVTVVLIESKLSTKASLPVQSRNVYVQPFQQPVIEKIVSAAGENAPITITSTLLIQGRQLRAHKTQVWIGGIDLTAAIDKVSETEIRLPLPSPAPPGLRAGVQPLQVVHPIDMGSPPTPHRGVESNVEAFVLRPSITPTALAGATSHVVNNVTVKDGDLKVDFNPKVGKAQRAVLLLNEFNPPATRPARAYSFQAPEGNGVVGSNIETASVTIHYNNVEPGAYLVRVQVDGAESLLTVDSTTGKYSTPQVTI